jgi:hypothetical protein
VTSLNADPTSTSTRDIELVAQMLEKRGFDEAKARSVAAILVEYEHRGRKEERKRLRIARLQTAALAIASAAAGSVIALRLWDWGHVAAAIVVCIAAIALIATAILQWSTLPKRPSATITGGLSGDEETETKTAHVERLTAIAATL